MMGVGRAEWERLTGVNPNHDEEPEWVESLSTGALCGLVVCLAVVLPVAWLAGLVMHGADQ